MCSKLKGLKENLSYFEANVWRVGFYLWRTQAEIQEKEGKFNKCPKHKVSGPGWCFKSGRRAAARTRRDEECSLTGKCCQIPPITKKPGDVEEWV